ncbi:hypothetical protein [Nocardioides bruguierae]|uniref:Lysine transporter LysE n=1 Tax=Nocardioides bruguierae TaxID=2945102 RepID=A0A9X2IFE1_9ACTN|nr:hypothetical protein [Nocardioides bruguierae]MCM0621741.1 hypothetical protein [Nocardioides bruguierae]
MEALFLGGSLVLRSGVFGLLLVSLGAYRGWRVAAAGALGVATFDGLLAAIVLVVIPVSPTHALVAYALSVAAAVVLLVVALLMARAAWAPTGAVAEQPRGITPLRAYLLLVVGAAVRPMMLVVVVSLALDSYTDLGGAGRAGGAVLVPAVLVVSACVHLLPAGVGAMLGRGVSTEGARRVTGLVTAGLLAWLALQPLATVLV